MKVFLAILSVLCLCVLGSCASSPSSGTSTVSDKGKTTTDTTKKETPPTSNAMKAAFDSKGVMVVEAEDMTLQGCDVVSDAKASGGKAVTLKYTTSSGSLDLMFDPGSYTVVAYEFSTDGAHDAFYAGVGNAGNRIFPDTYNVWVATKSFNFTVDAAKAMTFKFSPDWPGQKTGELGMMVDKFEITKK